jgi:cellulose synthase/poly-beta-1,6-N-acetylglucosamine synthase-like glycosyltransferase
MSLLPDPSQFPEAMTRRAVLAARRKRPIGTILIDHGYLTRGDLDEALDLQRHQDVPIGEILLANEMISEEQLFQGLEYKFGVKRIDLWRNPPDLDLIDNYGVSNCIRDAVVPWRRIGGALVIATSRPDQFSDIRERLKPVVGPVLMALASEADIHAAILRERHGSLLKKAETRVPEAESCRTWNTERVRNRAIALAILLATVTVLWPKSVFLGLCWIAVTTLLINTSLKLAAALTIWRKRPPPDIDPAPNIFRLPRVSIMVPLFKEADVIHRLVARLDRLTYPKALLDVCLVLEEDDATTRAALADVTLPSWMRPVLVPTGALKTKPRALNYALDFCRGSIIGIYDAEDAPDPYQIHRIAARFQMRPPSVACLQGVLDYYNKRTNWLSRCFSIEYATWFRIVLPGIQRMGLAVPLGGTTLFFRRTALEKLGGWDAHNVTEDADLGIRLARHGYTTELIDTVTEEEANCHAIPWIKQRSRWLKGYAITYAVHMRNPLQLWKDFGARKFIGFQIIFFGTLCQFTLAPVLWSFWLVLFGLWHPLTGVMPPAAFIALGAVFLATEILSSVISAAAVSGPKHRSLIKWVPTMQVYFMLGAFAAYKGLLELAACPFYWDKTTHGLYDQGRLAIRDRKSRRRRADASRTPQRYVP